MAELLAGPGEWRQEGIKRCAPVASAGPGAWGQARADSPDSGMYGLDHGWVQTPEPEVGKGGVPQGKGAPLHLQRQRACAIAEYGQSGF